MTGWLMGTTDFIERVKQLINFSQFIIRYWFQQFMSGEVVYGGDNLQIIVNPGLCDENRLMVLATTDGRVKITLTPDLINRLDLSNPAVGLSEARFRQQLDCAGIKLHGADYLFYFTDVEKETLEIDSQVRSLTEADREVFSRFQAAATEEDLDAAYVELEHWTVFGLFEHAQLVSAASMYPWGEEKIADLGVLTLEEFRGKGYATRVIRSICRFACDHGYEPQYRCQLDNLASTALAKATGLSMFGKWNVISPDSPV